MTLIVSVMSNETIWLLADRRLSCTGRQPKDDARKIMFLESTDGVAILGYAGLGATARGTEPSDWMSSVLRGRNMTVETSLNVLAKAAKEQLPRHMRQIPGHNIIVPAFVNNDPRLYTIDVMPARDTAQLTRHVRNVGGRQRLPLFGIGGSGASYLIKNKRWMRPLLRLLKLHARGTLSPRAVADHLAKLNLDAHQAMADQSVGPRCIVAWRHSKTSRQGGGGAHLCYSGLDRDHHAISLPTIGNGMDIGAIVKLLWPSTISMTEALKKGEPFSPPDDAELNDKLRLLPSGPDEKLR
jgi:hypothetical protein